MRWSQAFIPTLRDDPADAEAVSHRLLVRAGFIRQLMAGSYSLLPLGMRVATKVSDIIRSEMNAIGGQEFLLPVVHPGEIWKKTGRWDDVEGILVKFKDRKDADLLLAITHEEVFALLATEMSSYRDLPQMWYHLQTKFRDEPRPKAGLLRVREFTMKDSYSFDIDDAGLDVQFERHRHAYTRIFDRLGLESIPVEASSGAMGGSESVEFMVRTDAGEDLIAVCSDCAYAANVEKATSPVPPIEDLAGPDAPERIPTPGVRTIAALSELGDFAAPDRQIKTLVYAVGGEITLVLLRGDHQLQEQKLMDGMGGAEVRPAQEEEITEALGAHPGSLGAVGVSLRVVADPALRGRTNLVTGANDDDWHLRGVDIDRDIVVDEWLEVRMVEDGDPCPECDGALAIERTLEVGHIFKLGRKYAEALGATVLDDQGEERTITMGSYGIGVGRAVAAVVESHHDEHGMIWPVSVAPYEAVITVLRPNDDGPRAASETLYTALKESGIDVLLDDRDERPGVKFADAELIGIPWRVTIGPRGLESGTVELVERATGTKDEVPLIEVADRLRAAIFSAR
jgi:prolyl-tRNA synthetase